MVGKAVSVAVVNVALIEVLSAEDVGIEIGGMLVDIAKIADVVTGRVKERVTSDEVSEIVDGPGMEPTADE